jgi:cytidine deaminase
MTDYIDQAFVDAATSLGAARFPTGEAVVAALKTETGRILTSVHVQAAVDSAHLCAETGALCEAHKLGERVVAAICVYRETSEHPFRVIPPCGICQERLAVWGLDLTVAVPPQRAGEFWASRTLRELHPYDWSEVFEKSNSINVPESESKKHADRPQLLLQDRLSLKDYFEIVGKGAAGITVAFYLIGFVVVNTHLSRFGYYSVSLLSAQYLVAGVWALAPVVLGWFLVFYTLKDEVLPNNSTAITWVLLPLGVAVSLLALALFSDWFVGLSLPVRGVILAVVGFFMSLPTVAFFWWLRSRQSPTRQWMPLAVLLACISGLFLFVYVARFSRILYGDIPGTQGGGKPRLVRLVVKNEAKADLMAVGVRFLDGLPTSEPLRLLVATDKEYIFVMGKGDSSVSVRSDIVQAIVYEER